MKKIIRNAIRCKFCGDVIESETVLEFKFRSHLSPYLVPAHCLI